jgi:hypothetical protein
MGGFTSAPFLRLRRSRFVQSVAGFLLKCVIQGADLFGEDLLDSRPLEVPLLRLQPGDLLDRGSARISDYQVRLLSMLL